MWGKREGPNPGEVGAGWLPPPVHWASQYNFRQCSGSGSVGLKVFGTSRIRIRNYLYRLPVRIRIRLRILPSTSKKIKKNHDFNCLVTSLWLVIFKDVPTIRKVRILGSLSFSRCHGFGTVQDRWLAKFTGGSLSLKSNEKAGKVIKKS